MWLSRFRNRTRGPRSPRPTASQPRRTRLNLERLEERTLPSGYTAASVSALIADLSAANAAGGSNTIALAANTTFDLTAVNNTTNGANGLPVIAQNDNLTITGQGGDILQRDPTAPAFRLFDVASGGALTLTNLTLQNGLAFGSGSAAEDGAIYNQGSLALNGVTVQNNTAQGSNGSGKNNGRDAAGGGIWSGGNLTLANGTVIQSNQAVGGSGAFRTKETGGNAWGGGLYINSGSATVSANLSNNSARAGVGGTAAAGSGTFFHNPTPGGNGGSASGGGLAVTGGSLTLTSALLENNSAAGGGGGYKASGGNGSGGGLYAGGSTTVSLCGDTVEFNSASGGAGVYPSPSGQGEGGGIYGPNANLSLDTFSVNNTSNNTANVDPNIDGSYTLQTCAMLEISGFPSPTTAGAHTFTVTVLNSAGATWTGYTGTVHFSSSDPQAALPADYTFTSADQGVHTFTAVLKTVGIQSLTVTDKNTPTLTSTDWNITVNPAAASQLLVVGFVAETAGVMSSFTVTAEDPYGNLASGYTGTVAFTSSAAQATLPADYTFTSSDSGVHTFSASLQTAGIQSLTATDTVKSSMTGTQAGIVISPTNPVRFTVAAPANATVGTPFSITVTAWDPYNNIATNYTGTVSFTSTDGAAVLPAPYTFTTADKGVHTFTNGVTLKTSGTQTITATGTAVPAGITSWWPGEGNANDILGSNNGTLQGGATFAPGEVGQAFSFNGTSAYVSIPYSSSLALNTFTVQAWVNPATTPSGFGILGTRFGGEYTFDVKLDNGSLGSNLVHGDVGNSTSWISTSVDYPATLTPGTWHLITYVIDNGGKLISLYLDGSLQNTLSFSGTPLFMTSGETMEIGDSFAGEYFNGLIDEVVLYHRAISPAEVQWIYNAGSAGLAKTITGSASVTVGTSSTSPLLATSGSGGAPADPTGTATAPLPAGVLSRGAATSSAGSAAILADHLFALVGEEAAAGAHPTPQAVIVNGPPSAPAPLPRFDALLSMGAGARTMSLPQDNWMRDLPFARVC
jgi:hypothetical protein